MKGRKEGKENTVKKESVVEVKDKTMAKNEEEEGKKENIMRELRT